MPVSSVRRNSTAIKKHIAPTNVPKLTTTLFFGMPIAGRTYVNAAVYIKAIDPIKFNIPTHNGIWPGFND